MIYANQKYGLFYTGFATLIRYRGALVTSAPCAGPLLASPLRILVLRQRNMLCTSTEYFRTVSLSLVSDLLKHTMTQTCHESTT